MKPAIVVVTYNREQSLKRLLKSISKAEYNSIDIPLVISIDGGFARDVKVLKVAEEFDWKYGKKIIIDHKENLGLRKHILSCGSLTEKFDAVILLEDDMFVSNKFYIYSQSAAEYYFQDDRIGGIGLYSYHWNVCSGFPFYPLKGISDVYFMQFPASWGQCWTKPAWKNFKDWYEKGEKIRMHDRLPENVKKWPETSWLKYYAKYLVETKRYFVYPYYGYSTNFSDQGTHVKHISSRYQIPLNCSSLPDFQKFSEKAVKYDGFFEISMAFLHSKDDQLKNYDFEVDLYGSKKLEYIDKKYLLSTKKCSNPIYQYSYKLKPHEENILEGISEAPLIINFGETVDFIAKNNFFYLQVFYSTISGVKNIIKYLKDSIVFKFKRI